MVLKSQVQLHNIIANMNFRLDLIARICFLGLKSLYLIPQYVEWFPITLLQESQVQYLIVTRWIRNPLLVQLIPKYSIEAEEINYI